MHNQKIPCTVAILTRNSAGSLPHALESVKNFSEIIVCDGYSTDNTRAIAAQYSARVLEQDKQFLSSEGRIADYAGVRNQTLAAAKHPWFFFLDSDEYLSAELVEEIAATVTGEPGAYWVPREYVLHGEHIDCASTYPNRQLRLFHTSVANHFIKEVHERIVLHDGVAARTLRSPLLAPLPDTPAEMIAKWRGYLAIEAKRRRAISFRRWLLITLHEGGVACLLTLRMFKSLFCRGKQLPLRFEIGRLWYQWRLVADSLRAVSRL